MTSSIYVFNCDFEQKLQKVVGMHCRVYSPYKQGAKAMRYYKRLMPTQLTQKQLNVTVGLLLSDASMGRNSHTGKVYSFIKFGQERIRKDMVCYYHELMDAFMSRPPFWQVSKTRLKKDGTYSTSLYTCTLSSPVFAPLAELFYITYPKKINNLWGRKVIKPERYNYLNTEVLAFWFAGDGTKTKDRQGTTVGYLLFTGSFDRSELDLLIHMCNQKFGFRPRIQINYSNGQLRLYISKKDAPLFRSLVEPYLPKCCTYKL